MLLLEKEMQPLQYCCRGNPMKEEPGGLQSVGLQRVGRLSTHARVIGQSADTSVCSASLVCCRHRHGCSPLAAPADLPHGPHLPEALCSVRWPETTFGVSPFGPLAFLRGLGAGWRLPPCAGCHSQARPRGCKVLFAI